MKPKDGCKPILARHYLFAGLNQGGGRPVVWISGPPGSGKTTLVADYLSYRLRCKRSRGGVRVVWYAADPAKAALTCSYSAPALYRHGSFCPISNFTPYRRLSTAPFGAEPDALVLDDIDSNCLRSLQAATGRQARLTIMISNSNPPPDICRKRHVIHIGWERLRFSRSESTALITLLCSRQFTPAWLDRIHTHCAGWVGGLVMMLSSALGETDDILECADFIPEVIDDYFLNEIFDPLPADVRELLMVAAVMPSIDPGITDALTHRNDSGERLEQLYQKNLFVEKHRATDRHYRFHPLFRGFLLRLAQKADTHCNFAKLLAATEPTLRGQAETTFGLFYDCADEKRKRYLIGRHCADMLAQNQGNRLACWIDSLAPAQRESASMLHLKAICRLLTGDLEASRPLFRKALQGFQRQNNQTGILFALDGLLVAMLIQFDSVSELLPLVADLKSHCKSDFSERLFLADAAARRSGEALTVDNDPITLLYTKAFEACRKMAHDGTRRLAQHGDRPPDGRFLLKTLVQISSGDLAQARRRIEGALAGNRIPVRLSPVRDMLKILAVMCAWLSGRFGEARRSGHICMEGNPARSNVNIRCLEMLQVVAVELSLGYCEQAGKKIKELKAFLGGAGALLKAMSYSLIVWHAVLVRRIDEALVGAVFAVRNARMSECPHALALGLLCRALAFKEALKYRSASRMIRIVLQDARRYKLAQLEFIALLIKAEIEHVRGFTGKALESLGAALPLGRRHNYANTWLWRSDAVARLCLLALEAGLEKEYVIGLIRSRQLFVDSLSFTPDSWPWPVKIRTFGDFQIRVDRGSGDEPVRLGKKPLDMLKALIAMGPAGVKEHVIQDILWPEAEGDAACNAYRTTLYRLRKAIGIKGAVPMRGGVIYLNRRFTYVDAWVLEKQLDDTERTTERSVDRADRHRQPIDSAAKALSIAQGTFMEGNDIWCVDAMRARLNQKIARWRALDSTGFTPADMPLG